MKRIENDKTDALHRLPSEKTMLAELEESLENGFLVRETTLEAGYYGPPHWHDYLEWELITQGRGTHTYNGKDYPLTAGCAYLITYGDFHAVRAETPLTLFNVRFSESILPEELSRTLVHVAGRGHIAFSEREKERQQALCRRLSDEQRQKKPYAALVCRGILNELLVSLFRASTAEPVYAEASFVQNAVSLIMRDFRKELTVAAAAKKLCVSPNYFGSAFRKATGVSFNEYLNRTRLKYACDLLLQKEMPVKQIAYEAGYASTEYFLYVFRRYFGMTPSVYRTLRKEEINNR